MARPPKPRRPAELSRTNPFRKPLLPLHSSNSAPITDIRDEKPAGNGHDGGENGSEPITHSAKRAVPEKRVIFERDIGGSDSWFSSFSTFWSQVKKTLLSVSTGSLSDGLTGSNEVLSVAGSDSGPHGPHALGANALNTKSLQLHHQAQLELRAKEDAEEWFVDEVVVNGEDSIHHRLLGSEKDNTTTASGPTRQPSETGGDPPSPTRRDSDREAGYSSGDSGAYKACFTLYNHSTKSNAILQPGLISWLKWRFYPPIASFFNPQFDDRPDQEVEYQKITWYSTKRLAFFASLYLILNWALYLWLNHSHTLYEKYGGLTLFTLPVPYMVATNMSQTHPVFFQVWFCIAIWYCGLTEVIQIKQCRFFFVPNQCHGKDFLAMSYYSTALPALGMFICSRRLYNFIAQVVFLILLLTLIIPNQSIYARNVISFVIFSLFIQMLHYYREMNERRVYLLNYQLKAAYRNQQKAQIAESKASNAKRRFASYIFHEVRVPLNNAMLAYQNLHQSNSFKYAVDHGQSVELDAMESSLSMMQQVLDDGLDLDKMDAGRFESSPRSFPLHRTIRSILRPVAVSTARKNLDLKVSLDERIDQIPCDASKDELWVIGDDVRLRQVLTNLASNAVKFTPEGAGDITVTTKLLAPRPPGSPLRPETPGQVSSEPSTDTQAMAQSPLVFTGDQGAGMLVFRLEVHDRGPGVRPSDLVESRLFQPFAQTRVGKATGMGSGLGLAIVRQIVHLSGGRLGVQSRKGQGATFWVELVFPIATTEAMQNLQTGTPDLEHPPIPLPRPSIPPTESEDQHSFSMFNLQSAKDVFPPRPPTFPTGSSSTIMERRHKAGITLPPPVIPLPNHDAHYRDSNSVTTSPGAPSRTPIGTPRSTGGGATAPSSPSPSAASTAELMSQQEPPSVLVVDDDDLTRTLMTRMLTKLGCTVDTATDGQECLNMIIGPTPSGASPKTYDLISLDNHMPVMTGLETVRQLRALGRTDFVVGCTGNALSEDQVAYRDAGADWVLTKPIMMIDLKAALKIALSRRNIPKSPRPTYPSSSKSPPPSAPHTPP